MDVREAKLKAAEATLPATLRTAVEFEETFLRILAAAPVEEWLPSVQAFVMVKADDPAVAGARDVARAWLARAEMERIGTVLDQYHGENARYPATFPEVGKRLPAELRTDPWAEPWVYHPYAPKETGGETRQRYTLGPKRYPDLGSLRDAIGGRRPLAVPAWKIILHEAPDHRVLEFQQNGVTRGLVSAGGKIDGFTLLYVGDHWALMASVDQLFAVSF